MLSLFRINDPLRLVLIFMCLIGIRIYMLVNDIPITINEIKWILLGEKLNQGNVLYVDIWDNTPPLPALLYSFTVRFAERALEVQHFMAVALVMLQAYIFNDVILKKNIQGEKNYLPALLYTLLMFTSIDFLVLSPLLISLLFLLLLLRNLFGLNDKAFDEDVFAIGVYLGLAVLCYLPNLLFLPFTFVVVSFFRTASFRQYMLIIFGLVMTVGITILVYAWQGNLDEFLENFVFTFFQINTAHHYLSFTSLSIVLVFFITLFTLGLIKTYTSRAYINYQSLCQLIMILWTVIGVLTLFVGNTIFTPNLLIIFVPPIAFFLGYFFILFKKNWLAEIYFITFIALILGMSYYSRYHFTFSQPYWYAQQTKPAFVQKRILVFGDNFIYYRYNQLATPYLDWNLAQKHFANLDLYQTLIAVYQTFDKDLPEILIDEKNFVPTLFKHIPILAEKYQVIGKGQYQLKTVARR